MYLNFIASGIHYYIDPKRVSFMAAYHTAFKPEKNKYILEVIYDHGNDNQTHIFKFESHANRQKVMDKIEEG